MFAIRVFVTKGIINFGMLGILRVTVKVYFIPSLCLWFDTKIVYQTRPTLKGCAQRIRNEMDSQSGQILIKREVFASKGQKGTN